MAYNYQPYQQNQVYMQVPQNQPTQPVPDRLEQMRQQQYQQIPGQPMQMNQQMQGYPQMMGYGQPVQAHQTSVIRVLGEAEAQSYMVLPGASVVMLDATQPKMYIKSMDMNGTPSMQKFRLIEDVEEPAQTIPQDFGERFVPRQEFDEFKREHDRLLAAISRIAERMEVNTNDEHE